MKCETLNMEITLPRFGSEKVKIDLGTVIEFPAGLPGFEDCQRFKLFHQDGKDPLVFWLQSLDDTDVVFSLADPELLKISYELTLNDDEQQALRISPDDELNIAIMLSRNTTDDGITRGGVQASVRAPIVINATKRIALQKKLENGEVSIRA